MLNSLGLNEMIVRSKTTRFPRNSTIAAGLPLYRPLRLPRSGWARIVALIAVCMCSSASLLRKTPSRRNRLTGFRCWYGWILASQPGGLKS